MSPKHLRGLVLVAAWLVPMGAQAEEAGVGDVGVHSVDIPTVELAPLESALDHALGTTAARALTRTATLSALALDPNVAADRAEAKKAADRGLALLRGLDSKKALEQFDKAAALMKASHTDLLDPVDFAKLYTERAKIPLMVPNLAAMREEFAQAVPYHPTKRLDPLSFRPGGPAFPAFEEALQAAKRKPM